MAHCDYIKLDLVMLSMELRGRMGNTFWLYYMEVQMTADYYKPMTITNIFTITVQHYYSSLIVIHYFIYLFAKCNIF